MADGDLAVAFAAQLRLRGLVVPPDTVVGYARALDAVGLESRDAVYWAGRSTLIRRPEDTEAYDAAFTDFWEGQAAHIHRSHSNFERRIVAVDDPAAGSRRARASRRTRCCGGARSRCCATRTWPS